MSTTPANPEKPGIDAPDTTGGLDWKPALPLSCRLTLDLPLPHFTVGDLLRLSEQKIFDTGWGQSKDLPLRVNGTLLAWTEFELLGERLAVRITEIA